jgi:hypothetical protein
VLKLSANLERMFSERHGQAVAKLRAIQKRSLRQIEVCPVREVGKDKLARQVQDRIR